MALTQLGESTYARREFTEALAIRESPHLLDLCGIHEAQFKLRSGDRDAAAAQTHANREFCNCSNRTDLTAMCDSFLGLLALPHDPPNARQCLESARAYASCSGNVEVQLRCYHLAAEIARTERSYDVARSEGEAGLHLADTCGFGHYGIELRLALARVHLDAGNPRAALQRTEEALERSTHPECQYAWGEADALHLCGMANARLGDREQARQRLTAALAKREQLEHPGLTETRAELAGFGG
jgi:hypothetical protein